MAKAYRPHSRSRPRKVCRVCSGGGPHHCSVRRPRLGKGPNADHREGDLRGVVMLIEFDSMDAAKTFYESDEYTAAKAIREMAAETDLLMIEGV